MLSPRHESLVDNFGRIVAPGINMDAFLDDGVRARSQRLSDFVSAGLNLRLLLRLLAAHRGRSRDAGEERLGRRKAEVLRAGKAAVGSYEQENSGSLRATLISRC